MDQRFVARRCGFITGVAAVLFVAGSTPVCSASDLIATVSWTAPGGQQGTMLFQGTGNDGVLTGNAFAGNDRLVVSGTIGDDGAVSGSLAASDGTPIGTFAASLDANQHLQGAYVIFRSRGSWTAPADRLPVPAKPHRRLE